MESSMSSDKGIITTSSLSSSSSPSASPPSSSSSPSTNYPPSPPLPSSSAEPSSSSSSSPNSPPTDPPPSVIPLPSSSHSAVFPPAETPVTTPETVVVITSCAACNFLGRSCTENCVLATCFSADDPIEFTVVHRVFGASNVIKFLQELPESQRADAVSSMVYEANTRLRDPVYGCAGAICQLQKQVDDLQAQSAKAQAEVVNMQCQLQKQVIIHQAQLANAQALRYQLQKKVSDHQAQLAKAQVLVVNMQCQLQKQDRDHQAQLAKAQAEIVNMQCQQANLVQLVCMEMAQSLQASPQQSLENLTNTPMSFSDDNHSLASELWEPLWT